MTELERRAMLGDKDAQLECTEKGIVLPCPCCKGNARVRYTGNGSGPLGYINNAYRRSQPGFIMCDKCGLQTSKIIRVCRALAKWNTRPAPPIGRCEECRHYRPVFSLDKEDGMRCVREKYTRETKNTDFCSHFEPKEG